MFPDWQIEWNADGMENWRVTYTPYFWLCVRIEWETRNVDGTITIEVSRGGYMEIHHPRWPWKKMPRDPVKVLAMAKRLANKVLKAPQ